MTAEIHEGENPFATPEADRDPVRRFRGRLTAPVTILTTGASDERAGLTVSSLMVSEGDPGRIHLLLGPTADVYDLLGPGGRFVIHILGREHRDLSEIFAGRRPNPGGLFAGSDVSQTEWGPVIDELPDRAYCTVEDAVEYGYSVLVTAAIDRVEAADLADPLVYFRGSYRGLGE
jgi:flavin reductase (DIM6/NTAB) family NADH-FMN oxidoreductase RutF